MTTMHSEPSFKHTSPDQLIHEIAMPLVAVRNGAEEFASGTAFMIGAGVAVTAYHVVDDMLRRYEVGIAEDESITVTFELLAFLTLDRGVAHLPMKVMRIWRAAPLDLAVLAVGVPTDFSDDHVWKVPALSLLPPRRGDEVVAFGFPNSAVTRDSDHPHATWSMDSITATGHVIEIHHELRDSARLPFPCFRTNARFDGGMSGGPVLNNTTGQVCGVICSNLPATREDEEHVSYASTLWPIVGTLIDDPRRSTGASRQFPLMDFFNSGRLAAVDLERVRLVRLPDGKLQPQASYSAAEWDGRAA